MKRFYRFNSLIIILSLMFSVVVHAQEDTAPSTGPTAEDLAKQLANPVANLISVPLQNNFDFNTGPNEGFRYNLNVQPVLPFSLNDDWNLISRTIVPIISQKDVLYDGDSAGGLGDIVQSFFFSPKEPTKSGLVWGVGPVLLLDTASENTLGANTWAAGPNAVFLKLSGAYTYGALVNHMWSYAGSGNDISASFVQPFVTYAKPNGVSYTLASENTQSWLNDIFGGFVGVYFAKVMHFGSQTVQLGGGPKVYYGNNPLNPDFGFRVNVIFLFPK
ncbi:hypothetical protein [Formosa sp. A9]|uniref:hypothetical protein n=1 Tax=Formosa sp. A9 TaxID=3442641 RepID=UPI003EC0B31A